MKTKLLEKLAGEISQGDWYVNGFNLTAVSVNVPGPAGLSAHLCNCEFGYQKHERDLLDKDKANAQAIALVPSLLKEVLELRAELAWFYQSAGGAHTAGFVDSNPHFVKARNLLASAD